MRSTGHSCSPLRVPPFGLEVLRRALPSRRGPRPPATPGCGLAGAAGAGWRGGAGGLRRRGAAALGPFKRRRRRRPWPLSPAGFYPPLRRRLPGRGAQDGRAGQQGGDGRQDRQQRAEEADPGAGEGERGRLGGGAVLRGGIGIPGAFRCPPAPCPVGSRGEFVLAAPQGWGLRKVPG